MTRLDEYVIVHDVKIKYDSWDYVPPYDECFHGDAF